MFQSDYLMRMFLALAVAIRQSIERARGEKDLEGATAMLEQAFSQATEMDGSLLLKMSPESFAVMMEMSGTDPALVGYLSRTLLLEGQYLSELHNEEMATLRTNQAHALANAFNMPLEEGCLEPEALEEFFEANSLENQ